MRVLGADEPRERAFELLGESAGGEPEVQRRFDQGLQLLFVENTPSVTNWMLAGSELRLGEPDIVKLSYQPKNLRAYVFVCSAHLSLSYPQASIRMLRSGTSRRSKDRRKDSTIAGGPDRK